MFPTGDKPPVDSSTSLLQMRLLLLNRMVGLHAEIQSTGGHTVKTKKDLLRFVPTADRFEAQNVLNRSEIKVMVKASWDVCHDRITKLKTHIGMCQCSLAPHVVCQFVYCLRHGCMDVKLPNAAGCTFAFCTLTLCC